MPHSTSTLDIRLLEIEDSSRPNVTSGHNRHNLHKISLTTKRKEREGEAKNAVAKETVFRSYMSLKAVFQMPRFGCRTYEANMILNDLLHKSMLNQLSMDDHRSIANVYHQ